MSSAVERTEPNSEEENAAGSTSDTDYPTKSPLRGKLDLLSFELCFDYMMTCLLQIGNDCYFSTYDRSVGRRHGE